MWHERLQPKVCCCCFFLIHCWWLKQAFWSQIFNPKSLINPLWRSEPIQRTFWDKERDEGESDGRSFGPFAGFRLKALFTTLIPTGSISHLSNVGLVLLSLAALYHAQLSFLQKVLSGWNRVICSPLSAFLCLERVHWTRSHPLSPWFLPHGQMRSCTVNNVFNLWHWNGHSWLFSNLTTHAVRCSHTCIFAPGQPEQAHM